MARKAMTKKITFLLGALLLGLSGLVRAEAPGAGSAAAPLELGVFPYLSTRAILGVYQPLQQYLQRQLKRPVLVVTAPDMRTFVERTQAGAYPFVVTAPHFARLAQQDAGYRPLLRAKRDLVGIVLVAGDGPVRQLADLRGKTVAVPDSLAIITQLGLALLKDNGLMPGRDVTMEEMPSHNSAVIAVKQGAVAAAIVSATAFGQMPPEQKAGVRVLGQTAQVPHVMLLARRDVPAREVSRFVQLVQAFVETTPEGGKFIDTLGYLGLRPPTEAELRSLDVYLDPLRAGLAAPH
jgi:phosphonate transport system substrate-binding protein